MPLVEGVVNCSEIKTRPDVLRFALAVKRVVNFKDIEVMLS